VKLRDLCLMLNAGLPCGEAINLKVKDLELDFGRLRVLGKADVKPILTYLEARPADQNLGAISS